VTLIYFTSKNSKDLQGWLQSQQCPDLYHDIFNFVFHKMQLAFCSSY